MNPTGQVTLRGEHVEVLRGPDVPVQVWRSIVRQLGTLAVDVDDDRVLVDGNDLDRVRSALTDYPANTVEWSFAPTVSDRLREIEVMKTSIRAFADVDPSAPGWPDGLADPAAAGVIRQLTPQQLRDAGHLLHLGRGGNFSVPGAGKTTTMLAVWAVLRTHGLVDGLLVVAPASAFEAWSNEPAAVLDPAPTVRVRPEHGNVDADVLVVNYEQLERGITLSVYTEWAHRRRAIVVFDESHRIKAGRKGVRGKAARQLARSATRVFLLSGTPMPQEREDLSAQLDLAWPGYGARFVTGDLRQHLPATYARTTKDELDVPALDIRTEYVDLDTEHADLYEALRVRASAGTSRSPKMTALQLVAAASHPAATAIPEARLPEEVPAKLREAARIVRSNWADGRKTVVWSSFVEVVKRFADCISDLEPAVVIGEVSVDDPSAEVDRKREIARFRSSSSCAALIATPHTLGEGVSLHMECRDQVHIDRTFAAGLFLQSLDRTHRLGMDLATPARATVLVARGTIDERVHDNLNRKIARMASALGDRSLQVLALGTDHEIDDAELQLELRRHLAGGG